MTNDRSLSRRGFLAGAGAAALLSPRANAADSDWQAGAPPEWDRIMKEARAEGQVTVAAFSKLADPVSAAFKRDTGIQVNFIIGSNNEQSMRMEAEARAKNLTMDILIGGGNELGVMMREGFLNPVAPQLLLPSVGPENYRDGRLKWMDRSQKFLLQGSEYVFGWLLVNKNIVKPDELKSWKSLLDPKFRGKIASYDIRRAGPGQGASTWIHNAFGMDFIKDLFLGQQVKFTVDNRGLVEGVVRGTTPIAFAAVQNEVERFRQQGFDNLAPVLPDDGPGYLTGGFSVLKQAAGVPHPNAATVFINWYVSQPGQTVYESVMLETSRRKDVSTGLPDYLIPRPGVKYYEANNEDEYFARIPVTKLITEALGNR